MAKLGNVTSHAVRRIRQRCPSISSRELSHVVKHEPGKIEFIHRKTNTRSLVYVKLDGGYAKCIINRKEKKIITVLPWRGERCFNIEQLEVNGTVYSVTIYPDAYIETDKITHLTRIKEFGSSKHIGHGTDIFHAVFKAAWERYNEEYDESIF